MTNCFLKTSVDNLPTGLRVIHNSAPPANDVVDATYPSWPATVFTSSADTLAPSSYSKPGHERWAFVWANRRNYGGWNTKPNDLPGDMVTLGGKECRSTFTTVGMANAATRIQVRAILGLPTQPVLDNNPGLTAVVPYVNAEGTGWSQSPAQYFTADFVHSTGTYRVCENVVLLHPHVFPDGDERFVGITLDYECQDSRAESTTASFLHVIQYDCSLAQKKAHLLTNPFDAPSQAYTKVTEANLQTIFAEWDYVGVWLWSDNIEDSISASYATQIGMLPDLTTAADWAKVVIYFELGPESSAPNPGTTIADAWWVRKKLTAAGDLHPTSVQFWRNGAPSGDPCSSDKNRKISIVCFGTDPYP